MYMLTSNGQSIKKKIVTIVFWLGLFVTELSTNVTRVKYIDKLMRFFVQKCIEILHILNNNSQTVIINTYCIMHIYYNILIIA